MLKRHEIQVLRRAGHDQAEVAELASVSERTVRTVEREPTVAHVDDAAERRRRKIGRPAKAERFRAFVTELVNSATEPDLMSLEILRRARLAGYRGGKSALYTLIKSLRPERPKPPIVRFEGIAGEFTQHDFGQVDVKFLDGTKRRIHFFASRLKYSRWVEVSLVDNERVEALSRTLVEHFERMGGIPLLAVFDRPKTVALKWRKDGVVTEWNSTFASVAFDLGVGVEVCWPRSPRQKGSVENLVGWVKGSFFKQRRFLDEEDLRQQLTEWHREVNTERPSRATNVVPAERLKEERERLRPVKVSSDDLALRFPIVVGVTGMVSHDGPLYAMPPEAIGIPGTLYLHRDRVRIIAGRFQAEHVRLFGRDAKAILPEHRAQYVAAVSGKRGKRYLQRQHLLDLGPAALAYLTELVHRRPRIWGRDVEWMHDLLQRHGADLVLAAIERALSDDTFGGEYVAHHIRGGGVPPVQQELAL